MANAKHTSNKKPLTDEAFVRMISDAGSSRKEDQLGKYKVMYSDIGIDDDGRRNEREIIDDYKLNLDAQLI